MHIHLGAWHEPIYHHVTHHYGMWAPPFQLPRRYCSDNPYILLGGKGFRRLLSRIARFPTAVGWSGPLQWSGVGQASLPPSWRKALSRRSSFDCWLSNTLLPEHASANRGNLQRSPLTLNEYYYNHMDMDGPLTSIDIPKIQPNKSMGFFVFVFRTV